MWFKTAQFFYIFGLILVVFFIIIWYNNTVCKKIGGNSMKNGLAIWHYPHRTPVENVTFFADKGFQSVSILGTTMYELCLDEDASAALASTVKENNLVLTVHHTFPRILDEKDVKEFKDSIDYMAKWQEKYGLLSVLSFDVPPCVRSDIMPYIDYVLKYEKFPKVAVEDFGLTEHEREQIECLKGNKRFGYLIDVGHMYIRMRGENKRGLTLFNNQPHECPKTDKPGYEDFIRAFATKEFPIFEIHLHNNDGVDDLHYFFDDGTLDIGLIAKVLRDIKYDGILTIESAPGFKFECKYPESDKRILETFEQWKNLCETV